MTDTGDMELKRLDEKLIKLASDVSVRAGDGPIEAEAFHHERIPVSTMVAMHMQRLRPKLAESTMKHMIDQFNALMVEVRAALTHHTTPEN
jgi:hypothetical protein